MFRADWFVNRQFDLCFFHVPIWLCWLLSFTFAPVLQNAWVPIWAWVIFILMIDVGHVWSSIYRTYLDPVTRENHYLLLRLMPLACFFVCFFIALKGNLTFWRCLAYLAVYHFIKQQIGIAALYRARHPSPSPFCLARIDKFTIYAGTLCPVIYWHLHPDLHFNWFVSGDFLYLEIATEWLASGSLSALICKNLFLAIWFGAPILWIVAHLHPSARPLPLAKGFWVLGTWVNWYIGIVHFNSNLIFTMTNVVAHGIPYFALIGLYGHRKLKSGGYPMAFPATFHKRILTYSGLIALILFLAFSEEFLWNALLYRELDSFFVFTPESWLVTHPFWQAFWIACLSLPQTVHYILDGFIWKMNKSNPDLKQFILP